MICYLTSQETYPLSYLDQTYCTGYLKLSEWLNAVERLILLTLIYLEEKKKKKSVLHVSNICFGNLFRIRNTFYYLQLEWTAIRWINIGKSFPKSRNPNAFRFNYCVYVASWEDVLLCQIEYSVNDYFMISKAERRGSHRYCRCRSAINWPRSLQFGQLGSRTAERNALDQANTQL